MGPVWRLSIYCVVYMDTSEIWPQHETGNLLKETRRGSVAGRATIARRLPATGYRPDSLPETKRP